MNLTLELIIAYRKGMLVADIALEYGVPTLTVWQALSNADAVRESRMHYGPCAACDEIRDLDGNGLCYTECTGLYR